MRYGAHDAATYLNSGEVGMQLGELIASIEDRSPKATIVVTGYAVPFAAGLSPLTDNVNQLVELLNTHLALTVFSAAAAGAPVVWVPVTLGRIASAELRSRGSARIRATR